MSSKRDVEVELDANACQGIFTHCTDSIIVLDGNGVVQGCNPAAQQLLGQGVESLNGRRFADVLAPESQDELTTLLWSGFTGLSDAELKLRDGARVTFSVSRTEDDVSVLVMRDLSQRLTLDKSLVHSQRLASLGRLAAGLVHQLNNPLAVIQGRVELLSVMPDVDPANLRRQLDVVLDHCTRISSIVQNLEALALPKVPVQTHAKVHDLVKRAVNSIPRHLDRVQLGVKIEPPDQKAFVDEDQCVLMLANLLRQASDASPLRSEVLVEAQRTERGGVRILVHDQGDGLPEELLSVLRPPFGHEGSTHRLDPGIAFGLAVSWGIAHDHGGWLVAENRTPNGTTYQVEFPPAPSVGSGTVEKTFKKGDKLQVLVVDDDQFLAETVTWMLARAGHQIQTVFSAEEAVARLNKERFDRILIDIGLPGMSGEDLVDLIEQKWPELLPGTVLISGLLRRPKKQIPYLQKPFTRHQLYAVFHIPFDEAGAGPSMADAAADTGAE